MSSDDEERKILTPSGEKLEEETKRIQELFNKARLEAKWLIDESKIQKGKELGKGSFGTVYKGMFLGCQVAIKELHSADEDILKEFMSEVSIMKDIMHPNVVLWMGISYNPPTNLSIIMEFAHGGCLLTLLKSERKISWLDRIKMGQDIAKALAYLHDRHIWHRDLKAENVLLGIDGTCKVADFGLAKLIPESRLSKSGGIAKGSIWWRAPEVGSEKYDMAKADIFSFGVVLAELITRELGVNIRVMMTVEIKIPGEGLKFEVSTTKLIAFLQQCAPDCPPGLASLAIDCCKQDPSKRPELQEILARFSKLYDDFAALENLVKEKKLSGDGHDIFISLLTGHYEGKAEVKVSDVVNAFASIIEKRMAHKKKSCIEASKPPRRVVGKDEKEFIHSVIERNTEKKLRGDDTLSLDEYIKVWRWYRRAEKRLIISPMAKPLFAVGFINGLIGREASEAQLKKSKPNTAILRFSSVPGNLSVSYTNDDMKILHDLIEVSDKGFSTPDGGVKPTIQQALASDSEFSGIKYIYPDLVIADNIAFLQAFAKCQRAYAEKFPEQAGVRAYNKGRKS
eukprot:TRINITY_DN8142_c0_g1_i1.p1 TRINITY_DN8142_c0_g1~~TRINITY_DN8142_c0_g1_i1.p1  ORF type:complete len:594 (-),score=90.61 TRINITY_DN8142_c0_g1_i1:176-1879(-)